MDELSNFNARIEVEVRLRRAAYDRIAELEAQVEQLRLRNREMADEWNEEMAILGNDIIELQARNQTMREALELISRIPQDYPNASPSFAADAARAALSEPAEPTYLETPTPPLGARCPHGVRLKFACTACALALPAEPEREG